MEDKSEDNISLFNAEKDDKKEWSKPCLRVFPTDEITEGGVAAISENALGFICSS